MVCALWKESVGWLGKVFESSESDMVFQCLGRVSFNVLVWFENVVRNISGGSWWGWGWGCR